MSYVGKWLFHSIGVMDDSDELVFLNAADYLASPMPYVDETDPEAVEDELRERKNMIGMQLKICEDGKLYMLMPIPEGATQEEVDAVVASGQLMLVDGMLADKSIAWEERDGNLWAELGMSEDGWCQMSDGDGFVSVMSTRFVKQD